jgi:hypothetical protein
MDLEQSVNTLVCERCGIHAEDTNQLVACNLCEVIHAHHECLENDGSYITCYNTKVYFCNTCKNTRQEEIKSLNASWEEKN